MTTFTTPQAETVPGERHAFQAEIRQLLDIVIHSLYTEREIFVRELISNAADALEKFRHEALIREDLPERDRELEVRIALDDQARVFSISDSGIGMTREEIVTNLGTIAHSGTKEFLARLAQSGGKDVNLIGQFGVGFYSAFMVAKKVTVETRSYQSDPEKGDSQGWVWESDGSGEYTLTPKEGLSRGTTITIELKDDASEFANESRIKGIIRHFSSFVPFPVYVKGEKVNTVQALWTRPKGEITEEEYTEFYRFVANAVDEPTYRLHFSADAPLAINALLFVPPDNIERLGFGRVKPGVDLYCRKVLILRHPEELLPEWMRFLRGVIDSEDLPLNISREMLQDNRLVRKLSNVISGRFIKFLEEQAKSDPEKFDKFYKVYGTFLKEGVTQDFVHGKDLAKLLRFESSATEAGKTTTLAEYVGRMKDGQKEIYYINGPSREAIEAGPYLEAFKARGIEVLYTHEPIDDFVLSNLGEFEEKRFVSADSGDLDLPGDEPQAEGEALLESDAWALCGWLKEKLGERVREVKISHRLVESPAVVTTEGPMSSAMQRVMMAVNRDGAAPGMMKLEINPRHELVKRLHVLRGSDEAFAKDLAEQMLDNALLAAGLLLDPRGMVGRMNRLLERAAKG
jgi:TNF receptor-associated protein 1